MSFKNKKDGSKVQHLMDSGRGEIEENKQVELSELSNDTSITGYDEIRVTHNNDS